MAEDHQIHYAPRRRVKISSRGRILHIMNLKSAALLALVGMIVLTLLIAIDFINTFLGVMRDLIPAMALLRSFVYLLASLTMLVFLYVFHRTQR